jgi:hypothetical protein
MANKGTCISLKIDCTWVRKVPVYFDSCVNVQGHYLMQQLASLLQHDGRQPIACIYSRLL